MRVVDPVECSKGVVGATALLGLTLVFSLSGCGGASPEASTGPTDQAQAVEAADTAASEAEALAAATKKYEEELEQKVKAKEAARANGDWAFGTWLCSKDDETLSVQIVPPGQEGTWSTSLKIASMGIDSADSGTQKITGLKSESKVSDVVDEFGRPAGTRTDYILTVTAQNKKASMFNLFWLVPTSDTTAKFRVRKHDDVESYKCRKE